MQVVDCILLYGVPLFSKASVNTRPDSAMDPLVYDDEEEQDLDDRQDGYGNAVYFRNFKKEINGALGLVVVDRAVTPTDDIDGKRKEIRIRDKIMELAHEFIKYYRRVYVAYAKTVAVYQYALRLFDGDGFGRGLVRRLPPLDYYLEDDDEDPYPVVPEKNDDGEVSASSSAIYALYDALDESPAQEEGMVREENLVPSVRPRTAPVVHRRHEAPSRPTQ